MCATWPWSACVAAWSERLLQHRPGPPPAQTSGDASTDIPGRRQPRNPGCRRCRRRRASRRRPDRRRFRGCRTRQDRTCPTAVYLGPKGAVPLASPDGAGGTGGALAAGAGDTERLLAIVVDDLGLSFESVERLRGVLHGFVNAGIDAGVRPGDRPHVRQRKRAAVLHVRPADCGRSGRARALFAPEPHRRFLVRAGTVDGSGAESTCSPSATQPPGSRRTAPTRSDRKRRRAAALAPCKRSCGAWRPFRAASPVSSSPRGSTSA